MATLLARGIPRQPSTHRQLCGLHEHPSARAVWDGFVKLVDEGATAVAGVSGPACQALGLDARLQLCKVVVVLVKCWMSIMLGKWPRALGDSLVAAGYGSSRGRRQPQRLAAWQMRCMRCPRRVQWPSSLGLQSPAGRGARGSPQEGAPHQELEAADHGHDNGEEDVAGPEAKALEGGDE